MVAPIETQLRLEKFEENLYRSTERLWKPPNARGVFGGVVISQSLMAAANTVPEEFDVHSLHCYFIMAGDASIPIVYHVERVRDGRSFITRTVQAIQRGSCIFTTSLSFKNRTKSSSNTIHHDSIYPGLPTPREVGAEQFAPFEFKSITATSKKDLHSENGIEVRRIPNDPDWDNQAISQRRVRNWVKCDGVIENPRAHVMGLAYLSDSHLLGAAVISPGYKFSDIAMMVSLDHTIYFHQQPKADEWMMHCVETPWTGNERGLVIGRFFNQDGVHIATVVQEGVIRLRNSNESKI